MKNMNIAMKLEAAYQTWVAIKQAQRRAGVHEGYRTLERRFWYSNNTNALAIRAEAKGTK